MVSRHNYLKKREEREIEKKGAGLLSERFPGVSTIALHLTYRQRGAGLTLMKRTMHFHAGSPALFRMDCLQDECSSGGFDLTEVVRSLIRGRKTCGKGRLPCSGSGRSETNGHMNLAYEVAITYHASSGLTPSASSR